MTSRAETLRDEYDELVEREECWLCDEAPTEGCTSDGCPCLDALDDDEREKLAKLREIDEAIGGDWHAMIHEDDFADHAREVAEETSGIDTSAWPASCIDWENAADQLRADYTAYELDGDTFYVRV